MKSKSTHVMNILMTIGGLFIFNSCCTFIGLGIGASIDKNHKNNDTIEAIYINKINRGKEVELKCKDGKTYHGFYKGTKKITQAQYAENYFLFKKQYIDDLSIPDVGDTIEILNIQTKGLDKGKFIAFETNNVILESLEYNKIFHSKIDTVNMIIFHNGKPFIITKYYNLPRITTILIEGEDGKELEFPVNDLAFIMINYNYNAKLSGSIIGLVIDIAIIVIFISLASLNG